MDRFDRLPPALRRWLAGAALPWSAQSALRLWSRIHRDTGGDTFAVLRRLDSIERQMLARDQLRIWGRDYPVTTQHCGTTVSRPESNVAAKRTSA